MRYSGFVGPSARSRSPIACDDRTVNLFVEKNESGTGKAPYTMYRTPGYTLWCDLGTSSPVRGEYTLNGVGFAVAGGTLYQVPATLGGSATTLATGLANPDDGLVTMAGNGDGGFQLVLTAGSRLYCYNLKTQALTTIPDIAPSVVAFMDATFFALDPTTSTLYASDPEDGSIWDPLAVAQRTTSADKIQAMARVGTELWMMGSQTTTPYYDSGATDFPLVPNPSIFIQRGVAAPSSVAVIDNAAIWLGQGVDGGGTVYRARGYDPQPISTNAVEYAIGQYSTVLDAEAFIYQEEGHQFYVLTFPTANATWAYDLSEGLWAERGEWNGLDYDHLPIRGQMYCYGANLVGSRTTGKIYQQTLSAATETDGTTGIRWLRRAPHLCQELLRTAYNTFQLDAQVAVGLISDTSDPLVYLRWSDDGGQTWSNVHSASLGAIGQYKARVLWYQLGQARDRVFEVFGAAKVVTALIDAYLTLQPGTS